MLILIYLSISAVEPAVWTGTCCLMLILAHAPLDASLV